MHAHYRVCTADTMPENGVDLHKQPAPALLHTPASSPSNLFIRCHRKAALLMQEVKWIRTAATCCWLSYAALRCNCPICFDLSKCICRNARVQQTVSESLPSHDENLQEMQHQKGSKIGSDSCNYMTRYLYLKYVSSAKRHNVARLYHMNYMVTTTIVLQLFQAYTQQL